MLDAANRWAGPGRAPGTCYDFATSFFAASRPFCGRSVPPALFARERGHGRGVPGVDALRVAVGTAAARVAGALERPRPRRSSARRRASVLVCVPCHSSRPWLWPGCSHKKKSPECWWVWDARVGLRRGSQLTLFELERYPCESEPIALPGEQCLHPCWCRGSARLMARVSGI